MLPGPVGIDGADGVLHPPKPVVVLGEGIGGVDVDDARGRLGSSQHVGHHCGQGRCPRSASWVDRDDRHSERLLQCGSVHLEATARGDVEHGEGDDDPLGQLADLRQLVEAARQVGGVHDGDHNVRTIGRVVGEQ